MRVPTCSPVSSATNTRAVTAYLNEQIAAGADAVMIFDTWGGLLTTDAYRELSLAPMREVVAGLAKGPDGMAIPSIVFTKGGGAWLAEIAAIGASGVGLDWTVDIAAARRSVGSSVALQGNLDPVVLLTDPDNRRARSDEDPPRGRSRARAHLQSGTRHRPGHAAGQCGGAGRDRASRFARKPRRALIRAMRRRENGRQAAPVLALRGVDKTCEADLPRALMHTTAQVEPALHSCPESHWETVRKHMKHNSNFSCVRYRSQAADVRTQVFAGELKALTHKVIHIGREYAERVFKNE